MEENKTKYVVGFCFNHAMNQVVLIKKTHPEWQKGLLNGPGGKVLGGEMPHHTMSRKFKQEAGIIIPSSYWEQFLTYDGIDNGKPYTIFFFKSRLDRHLGEINDNRDIASEKEEVGWYSINKYGQLYNPLTVSPELFNHPIVPNLNWLLPLLMDGGNLIGTVTEGIIFGNPKWPSPVEEKPEEVNLINDNNTMARFRLGLYKPEEAMDYAKLSKPTTELGFGVLNPALCRAIYETGKFNNFMPANFWRVLENNPGVVEGRIPKYEHELTRNDENLWVWLDCLEGEEKVLPIIPAYSSGELMEMFPKDSTITQVTLPGLVTITITMPNSMETITANSSNEVTARGLLLIKLIEQSLI